MPTLSLIVITLNEEDNILRCLQSASFADELIVVDSGSTDRTQELAADHGARVIVTTDWPGFGPQKNRALDAATGDWILSLDADEWIEPETAAEIRKAIAGGVSVDGFYLPRRSRFGGIVVKHSGWWPDYVLRLFRSGGGRFSDSLVHEAVVVDGPTKRLSQPIDHRGVVDDADAENKISRYALAAANEMSNRGRSSGPASAALHGSGAFVKSFLLKRGFLDGAVGWRVAYYNARYAYRKWRVLYGKQHLSAHIPKRNPQSAESVASSNPPETETEPLERQRPSNP